LIKKWEQYIKEDTNMDRDIEEDYVDNGPDNSVDIEELNLTLKELEETAINALKDIADIKQELREPILTIIKTIKEL